MIETVTKVEPTALPTKTERQGQAMFPFFSQDQSVLVQPLYKNGNSLAFVCDQLLQSTGDLKVRDKDGHHAEVQIQQRRRADDQNWIYFAELRQGTLEPQWPTGGYQWRQSPRLSVGVRVRSPQLPEFTALSEDLSMDGMQLSPAAPLRVGDEIEVFIDLDAGFPEVQTTARVCWSKMTQPCRAGLAFLDLDDSNQRVLSSFLTQRHDATVSADLDARNSTSKAFEPEVLDKLAFLHSSFDDGDALVLKLLTQNEAMEIRLTQAHVIQSHLHSQLVSQIVTQVTPEGTTRTWLIDPQGDVIVEIESGSPEIVCRGLKLHDLDVA